MKHTTGQGLVEYAFLILLIGLAVIIVLVIYGETVADLYSNIVNSLPF